MYAILLKIDRWDAGEDLDGNFGLVKSIEVPNSNESELWYDTDVPKFVRNYFFDHLEDLGLFDYSEVSRFNDFYFTTSEVVDPVMLRLQLPTGYQLYRMFHFPDQLYREYYCWVLHVHDHKSAYREQDQVLMSFWTPEILAQFHRVV